MFKNNIDVIHGFAKFIDKKTIEVNGEKITADHILIATGTQASLPDIEGVEFGIDSNGFFELQDLPKRTAIIGSGYIAVELAGVLNSLGSNVQLFIRKNQPLRNLDSFLGQTLIEHMRSENIQVYTHTQIKKVSKLEDNSIVLYLEDGNKHIVDCLIWAVGRKPNTQPLDLNLTNIQLNDQGLYGPVDNLLVQYMH